MVLSVRLLQVYSKIAKEAIIVSVVPVHSQVRQTTAQVVMLPLAVVVHLAELVDIALPVIRHSVVSVLCRGL